MKVREESRKKKSFFTIILLDWSHLQLRSITLYLHVLELGFSILGTPSSTKHKVKKILEKENFISLPTYCRVGLSRDNSPSLRLKQAKGHKRLQRVVYFLGSVHD